MSALTDLGLMLIRGMVGYVMFFHGAQKLFGWFGGHGMQGFIGAVGQMGLPGPAPEVQAYAAALTEFGGGLLLMAGLLTRLAAVPVAVTMGIAAFGKHYPVFPVTAGGMEYPLVLMMIAVGLVFTGPGRLALDNLFVRRRKKSAPAKKD